MLTLMHIHQGSANYKPVATPTERGKGSRERVAAVGVQRSRVVGKAYTWHCNSKTDCRNRCGFSAVKQVQQGEPKNTTRRASFFSATRPLLAIVFRQVKGRMGYYKSVAYPLFLCYKYNIIEKGCYIMINYAHRGASEYAPENTLSSFYLGLLQGANGIETDVQKTKDGVLVLFHDDTVDRVSDCSGKLCDFTLEELKQMKIYGNSTTGFYDRIITLREFLEKFSHYDIKFALELKGQDVELETLNMAKEFGIMDKTTFTSFQYRYIAKIKELDPLARVGWLTSSTDDDVITRLLEICGEEVAPKADLVTKELVEKWRKAGLGVRAWGVSSIALMKNMCYLEIDGMTVNFPDRLREFLEHIT